MADYRKHRYGNLPDERTFVIWILVCNNLSGDCFDNLDVRKNKIEVHQKLTELKKAFRFDERSFLV